MSRFPRLRQWQESWSGRLSEGADRIVAFLLHVGIDENTLLLGFAVAIGTAVGLSVIVFYKLIDLTQAASLTAVGRATGWGSLAILVVVMGGLALTRLLVRAGTRDSDGENIPDVIRAVAKRGGTIHAGPVAVKTLAASLAIGVGGSVGAEGPVAVAGSALGSKIGRFFRSGPERLRVLVACGGAAGISAAFNAPIAGVFFSLEKLIGSFGVRAFPPVLVASVIAAAISRAAFGDTPVIEIPTEYGVGSPGELILYALLGVVTGLVAVVYTRTVYLTRDRLGMLPRVWQQVLVGACIVGVLDLTFKASLWGRGHETLSMEIFGLRSGLFLIGLAFAKVLATSVTLAVTRAGGVFTPALFIGATLGGGLALVARDLFAGLGVAPEAFALVGMAGLLAGATHAPLTAIMIVFEMTDEYALILPLMLSGAIAFVVARRLYPESIYSEWLARRGEQIHLGRDAAIMERLRVADVYDRNPDVIAEGATVQQILGAIGSSAQTEFPVLDAERSLVGIINYDDLRTVLTQPESFAAVVVAGDLARPNYDAVTPDDSLSAALRRLSVRGSHMIPVVDAANAERLLGVIGRGEILVAYDRELLRERQE